jgi:thioester reductase-like protein
LPAADTQWQVDFNLALVSFEPHIKGVRNLVDLASQALLHKNRLQLFFTSSVAVSNDTPSKVTSITEGPIEDMSWAGSGYGKSKLVAEKILITAAEQSGIDVTICRVGQIAGPVETTDGAGCWNRKEWLPSVCTPES